MLKKISKLVIVLLTLFYFNQNIIYAYEYINSENESTIENLINEIYDAKEQYEDLAGEKVEEVKIKPATNSNKYWLPIGSNETREVNGKLYADGMPPASSISSHFESQEAFRGDSPHKGIDFAIDGGTVVGEINIIASKSGVVVYPTDSSQINFEDNGNPNDAGGWGNHVKIKHADGTYTNYAHLAKGSITVMAGDVVEQGQVIGKMGNSGFSLGIHLHFEIYNVNDDRIDPEPFIDFNDPRPLSSSSASSDSFSLTTTSLSKAEFVAKMQDYYDRKHDENFKNNFLSKAEEIYDASVENNVNPELVVVTARAESSFIPCAYTGNYWGINIPNGKTCSDGPTFSSMSEGVAAYAEVLSKYNEGGSLASMITQRYNDRHNAGCDDAGHGLPGTLAGMQSVYSWVGDYRYNPGSSGLGGCGVLKYIYNDDNYCVTNPSCTDYDNCSEESRTTVCEQNDYTVYQLNQKIEFRYDMFGL